jgi:hypothetical protein
LQANFSQNPRQEYMLKLGFDTNEIQQKLDNKVPESSMNGLADDFDALGRSVSFYKIVFIAIFFSTNYFKKTGS